MTIEITDTGAATEMPRYRSHKEVWALKIAAIEFYPNGMAKIAPRDAGYAAFTTEPGYRLKFWPVSMPLPVDREDLGYYIRYADGYESWSPSKTFEDGYTPLSSARP